MTILQRSMKTFSLCRYLPIQIVLGLLWVTSTLLATHSFACSICVPYPKATFADRLLRQTDIVIARETPEKPYHFFQVEALRGPGLDSPTKIFCDSTTRRKLKYIPNSGIVLTRESKDDTWQMLTFADSDYQVFIKSLLQQNEVWMSGVGNTKRVRYFAQFLHHKHPMIQEQAYLEVSRAPYSMIRKLAKEVERQQLYDFLSNPHYLEWRNLYIHFLGQSQNPEDKAYIRKQMESALRFGIKTNLSAWVTAFIESHPETGLTEVVEWYFADTQRSKDELLQVITSMSILGSSSPSFNPAHLLRRSKIVQGYGVLLENYPELAGMVTKDLTMWQIRAHIQRLSEIRAKDTLLDFSEAFVIDHYLSMAKNYPGMVPGRLHQ